MEPRISLVTLGVLDFERALKFYRDGLGWEAQVHGDTAFFPLRGMVLGLYPREKLAEDATVKDSKPAFSGITLAHNVRSEGEVDEVLASVSKAGARIIKPGQKVFWGGYSGYFADLDGHLWEVAHNPFWKLDENGGVIL